MIQNIYLLGNPLNNYLFPDCLHFFDSESFQSNYNSFLDDSLQRNLFICPKCSSNSFSRHSSYIRYIIDSLCQDGSQLIHTLDICVIRCAHCGSFHAVLPAAVPAFSHYGYNFIFSVLQHFHQTNCWKSTCGRFSISKHMLSIFISKVESFFLKVIRKKLIRKLMDIYLSRKTKRRLFLDFLMSFFHNQASECTIDIFFGRKILLGVHIHSSTIQGIKA